MSVHLQIFKLNNLDYGEMRRQLLSFLLQARAPGALIQWIKLLPRKAEFANSSPALALKSQRNK